MEHLLRLEPDIDDVFSYALHENGVPLVRSITVYNDGTLSEENLSLEIRTDTGLLEPFRKTLQPLQPNEPRSIKEPELCVHVPVLLSLTEKQSCVLTVTLSKDGAVLASESKNVTVYPYDYWFGNVYPDILAAFVQPNHPVVLDLLTRTAGHMEKLTGSSALTAYLDNNPDTVVAQVAAAYSAIQELNLSYAAHPASFQVGQRIDKPARKTRKKQEKDNTVSSFDDKKRFNLQCRNSHAGSIRHN